MSTSTEKLQALVTATILVTSATFVLVSFTVPAAAANSPSITNPSLSETGNDELRYSFESDEQLGSNAGDIGVSVDGPNTNDVYTFDRTDFIESALAGGGYVYSLSTTQTYDDGEGQYVATVDDAKDSGGNNGGENGDGSGLDASYTYTAASVDSSSVTIVSGPGSDADIKLDAQYMGGMLQLNVLDTGDGYELGDDGITTDTKMKLTVTVSDDTPRALIGNARDAEWTRTDNGDGTMTLEITGRPSETDYYFPTPNTWPGDLTANDHRDVSMSLATASMSSFPADRRQRLTGIIFMTDAQEFGPPRYDTSGANDAIEFDVGAPHYNASGLQNNGFAEVYIPKSMLDHWGIQPADVTGSYQGQSRDTTISEKNGGALAEMRIHYSKGTAKYTVGDSSSDLNVNVDLDSLESAEDDSTSAETTPEETETATPTPTETAEPTPEPTETPTPTPESTADTDTATPTEEAPERTEETHESTEADTPAETTTGSNGPGFGVAVALLALLAAALLAMRRR